MSDKQQIFSVDDSDFSSVHPVEVKQANAAAMSLSYAINSASRLQSQIVDRLRLHHAISHHQTLLIQTDVSNWRDHLALVCIDAGIEKVDWYDKPDQARLPAISWLPEFGWVIVRAQAPTGNWLIECNGKWFEKSSFEAFPVGRLILPIATPVHKNSVRTLFKRAIFDRKLFFIEGIFVGVLINLLALSSSIYVMHLYDRVIPTQGYETLAVLTLGVCIVAVFELIFKLIRSHLTQHAAKAIDNQLSREIFSRLLHVRLDQLPGTVGSLSSQIRGYETIREFFSSSSFYLLVDVPFSILFLIAIFLIGNSAMAFVPLIFLLFSILITNSLRKKIDRLAVQITNASNLKSGLLVEAIEGAETIKAAGGAWDTLSRWLDVTSHAIENERNSRSLVDKIGYFTVCVQQLSYVALMALGAYYAAEGLLSIGQLLACSILSSRALAPISLIPGLMNQFANAKAALKGVEGVFALETDNHGVERPLLPDQIYGHYIFERTRFAYPGAPVSLSVQRLEIKPGDKVGVVGHIGSGKSTLLRLLSGMYQVSEGRVMLDNLDINQISRPLLSDKIAYLQQEHRLFSGTLRQNLLVGITDPGDAAIRSAAARTGLLAAINGHPKGLELMIAEGGKGLSGGQKQLVALTRILLSHPRIWLLDEPTASMDSQSERRCIHALRQAVQQDHTLVLVTHKPALLALVNRLIVINNQQIILDGPREQVLDQLKKSVDQDKNITKAIP